MDVNGELRIEVFYLRGNNPRYLVERVDWPQSVCMWLRRGVTFPVTNWMPVVLSTASHCVAEVPQLFDMVTFEHHVQQITHCISSHLCISWKCTGWLGLGGGEQNYSIVVMYMGFFNMHPHGLFNDAYPNSDDTVDKWIWVNLKESKIKRSWSLSR
jgi:hypothetical protein